MEQTTKARVQHKVYMAHNAPVAKSVKHGEKIYKYKYLDKETNEIKEAQENTFEKIQSYGGMCDYKKRIAEGTYDGNIQGNYGDVSELQMDTVDTVLLSEFLANLSQDEIATILQQRNANSVETSEEQEMVTEGTQETRETSTNTIPNASMDNEGGGN